MPWNGADLTSASLSARYIEPCSLGGWRSLHFYDVGGLVVRRWVPAQRRLAMEAWTGDGWAPYPDVDAVLRHGRRLTEMEALAVVHEARSRRACRRSPTRRPAQRFVIV